MLEYRRTLGPLAKQLYATGARLTWSRIWGTGLEIDVTGRSIEIDEERSGQDLGLSPAEQALLNREGDESSVRISYRIRIGDKHVLVPRIRATEFDLDGDAMANDLTSFDIAYGYRGEKVLVFATAYFGTADYDTVHPIYGVEQDDDAFGASITVTVPKALPSENWSLVFSAARGETDTNIQFYESRGSVGFVSAIYRF